MKNKFLHGARLLNNNANTIFLYLAIFLVSIISYHGDAWLSKWTMWEVIGVILLGISLYKRYGLISSLCFMWPLLGAIWIFDSQIPFTQENAHQILTIENIVLRSSVCWIISVLAIAILTVDGHLCLENVFGWFCIADSMYVICQFLMGVPTDFRRGIVGTNASLNASLIAVTFCYAQTARYHRHHKWLFVPTLILPTIAIFLTGASVPVGILAVVWISILAIEKLDVFIPYICGFFFICGYFFIPDVLGDSGRFGIWRISLKWWWENAPHWTGTGNGTFFIIGPLVQRINNMGTNTLFIWAHNDFLQTLIEQGYIGFALFVSLFGLCVYKTWIRKQTYLFAGLMGYGFASFFNFPSHSALFALVGILLTARSLDRSINS